MYYYYYYKNKAKKITKIQKQSRILLYIIRILLYFHFGKRDSQTDTIIFSTKKQWSEKYRKNVLKNKIKQKT